MEQRQQGLDRGADRYHRPGDLDDPLGRREDPLAGPRDDPLEAERDDPLDLRRDKEPLDRRDPLADEPGEGDARSRDDDDDDDDDEAAARRWEELTDRRETPPAHRDDATDTVTSPEGSAATTTGAPTDLDDARAREADGERMDEPAHDRTGEPGDERIDGVHHDPDDGTVTRADADRDGEDGDEVREPAMDGTPDGSGAGWPEPAGEELERPIEAPAAAPVQQPTAAAVDSDLAAEPTVVHSPAAASTGPAVAPPVVGTGTPAVGVATPATSPGGAGGPEPLVRPDEAGDFTRRWEDVQAEFLDSPRRAVEGAHELVGELLEHIRARLDEQRAGLHGRWSGDTEADTENLRVTMQGYRDFFRRLLSG